MVSREALIENNKAKPCNFGQWSFSKFEHELLICVSGGTGDDKKYWDYLSVSGLIIVTNKCSADETGSVKLNWSQNEPWKIDVKVVKDFIRIKEQPDIQFERYGSSSEGVPSQNKEVRVPCNW